MCGIVGYVGGNAVMNVVDGLQMLEYRGYDSAGIAYTDLDIGVVNVVKRQGRLNNTIDCLEDNGATWSKVAIGHTRWATHGAPSEKNAHPHTSGKISIVHNGIIDNYADLVNRVKDAGKIITSDTDSEIIAHLIDLSASDTLLDKVREACALLRGSYAIAVVSEDYPEEIVAARKKSPLVTGIAEKLWSGTVLSSDVQGLLRHTNKAYVLRDDEFAILTYDGIKFFDADKEITKEPLVVEWSLESTSRGNFETYMRKEIQEQPVAVIDTLMKNDWEKVSEFIKSLSCTNSLFIACGTSFNASKIGTIFLEEMGFVYSRARLASEVYYNTRIKPGTLVIAVSQSGETADTLSAVRYAKECGAIVLGIVNVLGSSLTREADFVIYTAAGPEISVASTKAFTSQLVVLYMLGGIFKDLHFGEDHLSDIQAELEEVGAAMHTIFEQEAKIQEIARKIRNTSVLFLGRGINTPVAYEGALKLKELSYLHAEGLPAGEIKHGPLALVSTDTPVVVLVPKDRTYDKMVSNIREVKSRGAKVIAVTNEEDDELRRLVAETIYVPYFNEALTPLLSVIPLQLLAYHVAKAHGCDIDKPRNLAKSVTVE